MVADPAAAAAPAPRRRRRLSCNYELLSCAWSGHVLVGTGADTVGAADAQLVRQMDGRRWHRCLRCDGWFPRPVPDPPTTATVPTRAEIAVPLRGPQLRDRYVLRLIALDRAVHVTVLTVLALVLVYFIGHHAALTHDYDSIMNALTGGAGPVASVHGFLRRFRHYFFIQTGHLYLLLIGVIAYGTLEAVEMVGLWFAKRWAEYLTFVATVVFIPIEIYELTASVSVLKLVVFAINVAIALYLLVAKRLFGLRGGHRALVARREALGGWSAVDRADAATGLVPGPGAATAA